ncbi:BREX-1 system adenine-specific DNA-methyltransferase PglX, partial [Rhodococcus sp. Leaf258]|uniref:BREX-1 system adenine-specific DNA-methyltransferase PglX n=1 Tax=Rhodococcus sp. Leaf258 TaxID=1736310 RepID=UPI000B2DF22E
EIAVVRGRELAEAGARVALDHLGVGVRAVGSHLGGEERALRRALRARARQLGDALDGSAAEVEPCRLLIGEVAYEQWHRLLFARFLEVNGLLIHPEFEAPVSLAECEEWAVSLGEPDGWSVAARFASQILPGVFKPSDPCTQVRLAREDLLALERVVTGLPADVFRAEDALGWVYQYWQSQAKKEVNESGRKIGGADVSPVTQLFTEHYMVRFLLENSLGAWWAGRHPDSPLLEEYSYLRRLDDDLPAAGVFGGWPARASEVTVMDPCCGSGHFLVAAFGMLWRMRAEEEGLSDSDAQDAVLRDNIFGLELDPRCTQIAVFALALEAWKQGGYRGLPLPNVACSGIPAKAPLSEWTALAEGDYKLESALTRLHALFRDADTLGSLIDPVRATEQAGLESIDWSEVARLVPRRRYVRQSHRSSSSDRASGTRVHRLERDKFTY